jgi:hypothetical protein
MKHDTRHDVGSVSRCCSHGTTDQSKVSFSATTLSKRAWFSICSDKNYVATFPCNIKLILLASFASRLPMLFPHLSRTTAAPPPRHHHKSPLAIAQNRESRRLPCSNYHLSALASTGNAKLRPQPHLGGDSCLSLGSWNFDCSRT